MSEKKEDDVKGEREKDEQESQDETISGKIWKMALPSLDFDAELVVWRCCSREAGAKRPEITILSDAVEGTFMDLDGKSLQEEQKGKHPRKWKRSKGADWTEMRKEEKRLKCTLLNG